ncbi:MAG: septum formation family protein [Actinomycetaceae bacterium]
MRRPSLSPHPALPLLTAAVVVGMSLASCGRSLDSEDATVESTLPESDTIAPLESETPTTEETTSGAAEVEAGQPTRVPDLSLADFDTGRPAADSDGVFTADPGQCLADPEPGSRISCDGEHGAEVFYTFNLDDGDYPGDDAVADEADDRCSSQLEAYLGGEDTDSTYGVASLTPSEETWDDDGDTEVLCLLTTEDPDSGSAFQSLR